MKKIIKYKNSLSKEKVNMGEREREKESENNEKYCVAEVAV